MAGYDAFGFGGSDDGNRPQFDGLMVVPRGPPKRRLARQIGFIPKKNATRSNRARFAHSGRKAFKLR